ELRLSAEQDRDDEGELEGEPPVPQRGDRQRRERDGDQLRRPADAPDERGRAHHAQDEPADQEDLPPLPVDVRPVEEEQQAEDREEQQVEQERADAADAAPNRR